MTSIHDHGVSSEFPFAFLPRSSDRELILVQLMTSVWETILQLPLSIGVRSSGTRRRGVEC